MKRLLPAIAIALLVAPRPGSADPPRDMRSVVVERLRAGLDDPDRGVRYAAVQALGKAGEPPEILGRALEDPAWCVRQEAAWWLRGGGDAALVALDAALSKGSPRARASAAWSLSSFGAKAVPLLRRAIADADEGVRLEALAAARRLGLPDGAILAAEVGKLIASASAEERYEAALALVVLQRGHADAAVPILDAEQKAKAFDGGHETTKALLMAGPAGEKVLAAITTDDGKRTVERLRREIQSASQPKRTAPPPVPEPEAAPAPPAPPPTDDSRLLTSLREGWVSERIAAARALGAARADALLLMSALKDPERDVRVAVAIALSNARGDANAAALALAALNDRDWRVKAAAIRALGRHHAGAEAIAPFLADPVLARSLAARDALAEIGPDAAEPTARMMATGHYGVLEHAVFVFDALGEGGKAAVPLLIPLLTHADVNVRETAARCLRAVGPGAGAAIPALVTALGDSRLCVVAHAALALGRTGLSEPLIAALSNPRARARAYAALAAGWVLGEMLHIDQVPFEVRLPVEDAGRAEGAPTAADLDAAEKAKPAEQKALLRRALWSKDAAVALRGAAGLTYEDLDAVESERAMEVMLPEGMRRGTPIDFEELRSIIGSSELPAHMMYLTRARATNPEAASIYGHYHRISRADLLPALYWFHRAEEPPVVAEDGDIWMPAGYSPLYLRESALQDYGRDPGPGPGAVVRFFLREFVTNPDYGMGGPLRWALGEFESAAADAPLLLAAAKAAEGAITVDSRADWWATLRALGRLSDADSLAYLKEVEARDDEEESPIARSALARRGDPEAARRLVADSRSGEAGALALLLEVAPGLAVESLAARLTVPKDAASVFDEFVELPERITYLGDRVSDDAFLGVEPAVAAKPPDALTLGRIAARIPGCATRRIADHLFTALEVPAFLPDMDSGEDGAWGDEDADRAVAFLSSADADRALKLMRRWAAAEPKKLRAWAVGAVLRLGDRESAPQILEHLRSLNPKHWPLEGMERVAGPEIVAFMRQEAAEFRAAGGDIDAVLVTLGLIAGWPEREPLDLSKFPDEKRGAVRKALLAGDLAVVKAAYPYPERLMDPQPPSALAWERLGRASLAGDAAARADFWSAMRAGRYRWVDNVFNREMHTLGHDPATIPHWLNDLDSNCCRNSDGLDDWAFERPYDVPLLYGSESRGVGQPLSQKAALWLSLGGGKWKWSPLLDRLVPIPE